MPDTPAHPDRTIRARLARVVAELNELAAEIDGGASHPPQRDLLTGEQVAAMLGIGERVLRQHVHAGRIAYVTVSGGLRRPRRMFRPDDVAAFIDRQRTTAPQLSEVRRRPRTKSHDTGFRIVNFAALRANEKNPKRKAAMASTAPEIMGFTTRLEVEEAERIAAGLSKRAWAKRAKRSNEPA